ncbi:MAG: hypothetical protein QM690_10035 [Sphingobium sp.]
MMLFRSVLMLDLRSADFGTPHEELYPAALDMIEYAHQQGFDNIVLAEHHALLDHSIGTHRTEDVEKAWREIGGHALFMAKAYVRTAGFDPVEPNSPLYGLSPDIDCKGLEALAEKALSRIHAMDSTEAAAQVDA